MSRAKRFSFHDFFLVALSTAKYKTIRLLIGPSTPRLLEMCFVNFKFWKSGESCAKQKFGDYL